MLKEREFHLVLWLGIVVVALGIAAAGAFSGLAGARIVDSWPAANDEKVPITAPIRMSFSQLMDVPSVESRLRIEPTVAGTWLWEGKDATFVPQSGLAPDTVYTVTLESGASGLRGRALREEYAWQFRTRRPRLLYLGRSSGDAESRQLFSARLDGSRPEQLTEHEGGVWDYAVHPQGDAIVYSVLRADGGSDLWRMDRDGEEQGKLLACPGAACLNPAWSSDGRQLAYERRNIWADAPNLDPKAGRIWLLDLEDAKEGPLFEYDVALHSPVWAPHGERLAYVSPMLPGIEVYELQTEELQQFGNEWGAAPVWSPDGTRLVLPELMLAGESLVVRLVLIDLGKGELLDISGDDDFVKDVAPAWSPGGGWIAFGRQFLDEERSTPGRQLWLTRPDGSEAYALLDDPMGDHFGFSWRPDGAVLAYVRSDLSEGPQPIPDVSVWVLDLVQRASSMVATDAVLPTWLP
jgi:Tol biopolymer transport system component